jgi:hypothetical protein
MCARDRFVSYIQPTYDFQENFAFCIKKWRFKGSLLFVNQLLGGLQTCDIAIDFFQLFRKTSRNYYSTSTVQYSTALCANICFYKVFIWIRYRYHVFFHFRQTYFLPNYIFIWKSCKYWKNVTIYIRQNLFTFFTKLAQRSLRLFKNTIKPGLGTQVIVIIYCQTCMSLRMSVGPVKAIGTVKISFNKRSTFLMKMCEV